MHRVFIRVSLHASSTPSAPRRTHNASQSFEFMCYQASEVKFSCMHAPTSPLSNMSWLLPLPATIKFQVDSQVKIFYTF